MERALRDEWLWEWMIASTLWRIMKEAMTITPDGQPIEDFKSKLWAIKVWMKMMNDWPDTVIAIQNVFWDWPTL